MAKRVAALVSRSGRDASERAMREVATSTGAELFVFEADGPDDYPAAFAAMRSADQLRRHQGGRLNLDRVRS